MRKIDPFFLLIMAAVAVASVLPAQGASAEILDTLGIMGIALLFFVHGAALPRAVVIQGLVQWRLHLFIFAITFVVFPVAVLPFGVLPSEWMPADLLLGFLYLAALPSAVSSSIAFTAMARGNVPTAICSSAASNVFGLLLTPVSLSLLTRMSVKGSFDLTTALGDVILQLLVPFAAGQIARPWLAGIMARHESRIGQLDQGVILLIVYAAFSQSVIDGLWSRLPPASLALTAVLCLVLLTLVLVVTAFIARRIGFSRSDEIAAVFCGSKKSLASGLPLAKVLFATAPGFGMIVLPIMFYNQIQILVGAVLARWYAQRIAAACNPAE
ncbi:bile acid:sodium symporter family protein [Microvirga lotononidis]|uniref:Putative Na+-dependent transporter n=1 Tax=Microvirga lotononidis TaxID=864069 RepID=I4YQN8_9HYPH|nr:bile acid:sodium symporter family protein [Microvirga lotononidis]EIM26280.1 putative Na+-dependent transporter [Microvirga lotononidis]WQO30657.1 bile acid:sodium symporter family protein [Microvirga lotononidis]